MTKHLISFQWDERYATGIGEIDAQHQRLFGLTNQLVRAAEENSGHKILTEILGQLEEYAATHFSHEESIMEWAGYADIEEHRRQHAMLRDELDYFVTQMNNGALTAGELAEFVQSWLAKHIIHEDMRYLPAIRRKQMG